MPTGPDEALAILRRFGVDAELPEIVSALSAAARAPATPSGDAAPFRIVASNRLAAEAALEAARGRGFDARLLTTHLQGEARKEMRAGNVLSLREIERRVLPTMGDAEYLGPAYDSAAMAYRLKLIKNGRVMFVDVDARTGKILRRTG